MRLDQYALVHVSVVFGRRCSRHRRRFTFARHKRIIYPRGSNTNVRFMNGLWRPLTTYTDQSGGVPT
jgi:hypothetical protein